MIRSRSTQLRLRARFGVRQTAADDAHHPDSPGRAVDARSSLRLPVLRTIAQILAQVVVLAPFTARWRHSPNSRSC